ncbi:MAG: hypothetical protein ACFE9R_17880 [Candidatus Hermodarchaeota archaeon]
MLYQFINPYWNYAFSSFENFIWSIISFLIFAGIFTLFLKLGLGMFNNSEQAGTSKVVITTSIITVSFIPLSLFMFILIPWIIIAIFSSILIKVRHHISYLNGFSATIVIIALYFLITFILGLFIHINFIIPLW